MSNSTFDPPNQITRAVQEETVPTLPSGGIPMGVYRAADPALNNGDAYPLRIDAAGRLATGSPAPVPAASLLRVKIDAALAADNTIIAAPLAGNRIRLYHYNFLASAPVNITLKDGATDLSGTYPFIANMGFAFDAPGGIYPTTLGDAAAFVIALDAAVQIDGYVLYTVGP